MRARLRAAEAGSAVPASSVASHSQPASSSAAGKAGSKLKDRGRTALLKLKVPGRSRADKEEQFALLRTIAGVCGRAGRLPRV